MERLRQRLVNRMLSHEGLVAVPQTWQNEYVKLAGDKIRNCQTIDAILKEYNELLKDYYNKLSIKELQNILKEQEVSFKSTASKEELVDMAFREFQMKKEKN